jgi:hypothetical protein
MKIVLRLFFAFSGMLPLVTTAQWAWIDQTGHKVFSDRPPAADIPDKAIFKRPATATNSVPRQAAANTGMADSNTPPAVAVKPVAATSMATGIDKDLAERKKKDDLAQAALRTAEEERIKKGKAESCQRAQLAQKQLTSGMRIARMNSQGEREVMDDAARAVESKRIESIITSDCH